jgi:hypothetical protein
MPLNEFELATFADDTENQLIDGLLQTMEDISESFENTDDLFY